MQEERGPKGVHRAVENCFRVNLAQFMLLNIKLQIWNFDDMLYII